MLDYPVQRMNTPRRRSGTASPLLAWMAALTWMAIIFVVSSIPYLDAGGRGRLRFDPTQIGHLVAFTGLGILVAHALDSRAVRRRAWWTFVFCVLYAALDEIHQAWVPGRDPSFSDLTIDAIGSMIGFAIWARAIRPAAVLWRRRLWRRRARPRRVEPMRIDEEHLR